MVKKAKNLRVLFIDSEPSGEEIKREIEDAVPINGRRIHVALANTERRLERLLWMKKKLRDFDLAIVDMHSDLGRLGPLVPAIKLDEKGTPVLIYSPMYTGFTRLQQLQEMVSGAFSGVFEQSEIPDAAQLLLHEPQKSKKFDVLLRTMRYMGEEAREAEKTMMELIGTMSDHTRELCERLLAREKQLGFTIS